MSEQARSANTTVLKLAVATEIGGRTVNADAACVEHNPLGAGASVVDGIGDTPTVAAAARRAADTAAVVASHRGAQAGIMAAADTMPDYPGAPNAVAAVVSVEPGGRIEVAHADDAAVWTWSRTAGLRRWTVDQTVGEHVRHMLANPNLTLADRVVLDRLGVVATYVLSDYVLNGFVYATVSTISWTLLRGEHADVDLILVTSDGIHKRLTADQIAAVASKHVGDVQTLVDRLVAAAITSTPDPGEVVDNATAAAITLHRTTTTGADTAGGA